MDKKEIIYARPGQSLENFKDLFNYYKMKGIPAFFEFNGKRYDTEDERTFDEQYNSFYSKQQEEF